MIVDILSCRLRSNVKGNTCRCGVNYANGNTGCTTVCHWMLNSMLFGAQLCHWVLNIVSLCAQQHVIWCTTVCHWVLNTMLLVAQQCVIGCSTECHCVHNSMFLDVQQHAIGFTTACHCCITLTVFCRLSILTRTLIVPQWHFQRTN